MRSPEKPARTILAFTLFATIFLDYWTYSQQYYREPGVYADVLLGTASAPNQYRVGAIRVAHLLAKHGHMGLRHGMALLDGLSAAVAVYVLYELLRRSTAYRSASVAARWFGSAAFIVLVQFYLVWLTWYQRPETLPTAAIVALNLWLLSPQPWNDPVTGNEPVARSNGHGNQPYLWTAAGLVFLAGIQGLVRADVGVAVSLGILLLAVMPLGRHSALPRGALGATGALGFVLGVGIQMYMMRVVYPHATYGSTPVFQLVMNATDRLRIIPFVIFLLPWGWTVWQVARRRLHPPAPSAALLAGSLLFLPLWCVVGKIDEVRIFLPFALAIAPLTVQAAMQGASTLD